MVCLDKGIWVEKLDKAVGCFAALPGLASLHQSILDDQNCAGLWKKDLMRCLVRRRGMRPRSDATWRPPPDRGYRFPSWSSASIEGGTTHNIKAGIQIYNTVVSKKQRRLVGSVQLLYLMILADRHTVTFLFCVRRLI